MMSDSRGKELVLAPGTYAYMQDTTKGQIKVFTGPTVINQTAQEVPVVYNHKSGQFERCEYLEQAVRKSPIAVEGYYLVLLNPAAKEHGQPDPGLGGKPSPELDVGRRINIAGPCMFPLWPGQTAWHIRGHHLRSNQYLLVRVYNEEEAKRNWGKAVVKRAATGEAAEPEEAVVTAEVPQDLTVGRLLIVKGTEVSFYIPPTGISVVQDGVTDDGKPSYVRDALTLERLEYAILVDENGNKRYERGPKVVFPEPTERFITSRSGRRKSRAVELNEIQGLHIKVIASYEEDGREYREGDELFITGKETAIYYPREEHSLISYDGRAKHFATAIPVGEARYVMDRISGAIEMVRGPEMLLPDPRGKVIVRRVLSDAQCGRWYPGNEEAVGYNRQLRELLKRAPTTRSGVISEGDYERGAREQRQSKRQQRKMERQGMVMEHGNHGDADSFVADEFTRASTYTQPRTITLDTRFQGVPSIDIWTGYAVMVVSKTGKRHAEVGPTTVLLDYDETLEVVELSTAMPKSTDRTLRTVYLRVANNHVSDLIRAETADHVAIEMELSYRVNFEGDPQRWFNVENYVKLLTEHTRSVLKSAVKKMRIGDFYGESSDLIRQWVLGQKQSAGDDERGRERPGMRFDENGMRVADVEVLNVSILDPRIQELLDQAQHQVVKSNIELSNAEHDLTITRKMEQVERELASARAETARAKNELQSQIVASELAVALAKIDAQMRQSEKDATAKEAAQKNVDLEFDAQLARDKREADQREQLARTTQQPRCSRRTPRTSGNKG
jgi:major vault protein